MAVYLIRNVANGRIKIGTSNNPGNRIRSLQTASSDKLEILALLDGSFGQEKELHRRFARCRIAGGEWFEPDAQMEKEIGVLVRSTLPIIVNGRKVRSVYLAGKITGDYWRNRILDPASIPSGFPNADPTIFEVWPTIGDAIRLSDGRRLDYAGPFFVSAGEHWRRRVSNYGHASDECRTDLTVTDRCFAAINSADLIFAWINSTDCYGTVAELGYAKARGKLIFISGPRFFPDLWFAYRLAHRVLFDRLNNNDPAWVFSAMLTGELGDILEDWRECRVNSWHADPIDDREPEEEPEQANAEQANVEEANVEEANVEEANVDQ